MWMNDRQRRRLSCELIFSRVTLNNSWVTCCCSLALLESNIPKPSGKFSILNYQLIKIGLYEIVRNFFLFLLNFIGAAQLDLSTISKLLVWLRVVNVPWSQSLYGYRQHCHLVWIHATCHLITTPDPKIPTRLTVSLPDLCLSEFRETKVCL